MHNVALVAFIYLLQLEWCRSLSKLTFAIFPLKTCYSLFIFLMVDDVSEFFHSATLCKELVDSILDRLCYAGLISSHLLTQRNFKDEN